MRSLSREDARSIVHEGKRAHNVIGQLIRINNLHLTEEFIDLFRERFTFLFRGSMKNYTRRKDLLLQTSRIVHYLETILLPNFRDTFDLNSLSPELQSLFLRSINDAYIEFKKRHNIPA